ncbi:MAG TPA: sulfate/molybdate ABC transporter ATP-binding protein [Paracoccus solventivorans]|uniref:sulfate/molybdate ABC transporter ATP-binding protein n=1 Tax=Paracoccus solventivorans TaxID=53463 RepID=UPI002BBCF692|nr:sulfate/molybdate ABC transporter ATP-binding protein [Paracoccus solventivorans]HMM10392.1 sulfate/molybdate ABC transporter ATP-binding protein [Paracoccus solventivorans]
MTIEIADLTRRFDRTEVLRGINLAIAEGELVALLGPSGSGKTTLLKIIAGLDWPDTGSLMVNGQDWLAKRAQDRRAGFVFQHYALFPHMKVRDNIAFGLTVLPRRDRPSATAIRARVDELMRFLQISALADRFPAELSGGQRQRVALGRAMAISPAVLLLDEPFGALDALVRRDLRRWLRDVLETSKTTSIFVTHDQEEAFELADRVVIMGAGRIEQIGRPDEIYDHPATPFVARFLGLSVELPVRLRAGRVEAPGLDATALPRRAMADGPATLFARPADLLPVPAQDGPLRVAAISSTGALLHVQLTDDRGLAVETEVPRRRGLHLSLGQRVTLRVEAGQVFRDGTPAETPAADSRPVPLRYDHSSKESLR